MAVIVVVGGLSCHYRHPHRPHSVLNHHTNNRGGLALDSRTHRANIDDFAQNPHPMSDDDDRLSSLRTLYIINNSHNYVESSY